MYIVKEKSNKKFWMKIFLPGMTNFDRFRRESIFDLDSIANLWGLGASMMFQIIQ